MIEKFDSMVVV